MYAVRNFFAACPGAAIPYEISNFSLGDMLKLAVALRPATDNKATMEEAATELCRMLYDGFTDAAGTRACALVRFYKTHPYSELPSNLQAFATKSLAPIRPRPDMNCLTLIGTVGDEPSWNSRARSRGHQAIPLASPEVIEGAPMIAQLVKQFGMDVREVIKPGARAVRDLEGRKYGVFYVPTAVGSPYIPAQSEFVLRYGIQSVLGFGGTMPSGDLFAMILFSKTPIHESATNQFRRLAADVRVALGKYRSSAVFN